MDVPAAIIVLGIAALAGVVGVALGILVAPALGRLAERLTDAGDDDEEDEDGR